MKTIAAHEVMPHNVGKFRDWLANRGGIAVWRSVNLSNPCGSWSTPVLTVDGTPHEKPTWEAESTPSRIITDPAEIVVTVPKEVKRFHIAVRWGSSGLALKVTEGSTHRIHAAVTKAGEGAWFELDHSTQEAVILIPQSTTPLDKYTE